MLRSTENLENCVLGSFLFFDHQKDNEETDIFELDPAMFTTPLKRRIAEKINEESKTDKFYQQLGVVLEEQIKGTKHEHEMIQILGASPMYLKEAKKLYARIIETRRAEAAKGLL